jgi:histidine ammonia-lyase
MNGQSPHRIRPVLGAVLALGVSSLALQARADDSLGYHPIKPTMANQTVTLNGHDMTLDQFIAVSRYGAKIQISPEAKQREADNYGLLLEAPAEGVSVYWFTRGAGGGREVIQFEGDPLSDKNKAYLENKMMNTFSRGGRITGEVADEDLVRGVMVARANAMTFNAPSPQLAQMLTDLINNDITPLMAAKCSVGEGDLCSYSGIEQTMVGAGEAYYHGMKMSSKDALAKAGLKPIQPFAADDNALTSSNGYATALAAFAVADAKKLLEWSDIAYAADLNGMNSSISPMSYLVETDRPIKWLNWDANRVMEMIRGGYLFNSQHRIIQDPESMRAGSIRQGSAWQAWGVLYTDVMIQLNSSDHNPAIRAGLSPSESWDLQTPELMKYYVKGGKNSNGKGGFIFSNANWDPYPLANDMEYFAIALANMDISLKLRTERFGDDFFTEVPPAQMQDLLKKAGVQGGFGGGGFGRSGWQDIQGLINPVTPEGFGGAGHQVEELEAQTTTKGLRLKEVVEDSFGMVANDFANGARWVAIRKAQDPTRSFGKPVEAALEAMHKAVAQGQGRGGAPAEGGMTVLDFMKATPATTFYPTDLKGLVDPIPRAGGKGS